MTLNSEQRQIDRIDQVKEQISEWTGKPFIPRSYSWWMKFDKKGWEAVAWNEYYIEFQLSDKHRKKLIPWWTQLIDTLLFTKRDLPEVPNYRIKLHRDERGKLGEQFSEYIDQIIEEREEKLNKLSYAIL